MAETNLSALPTRTERNLVADTLKTATEQDFDEVVLLGFKDGKSYLFHSKIEDIPKLIGAIEWLKFRMMQ